MCEYLIIAKRLLMLQYSLPLCLYFPAPILTGACFLIADKVYGERTLKISEEGITGSQFINNLFQGN